MLHRATESDNPLTVVVSAGQSRNPEKRQLEDAIANLATSLPGVHVIRVPHLYDLPKDSQTYQSLREISGDLVVLCWLFDRATHWILDRQGIRGQVGEVELKQSMDDEAEATEDSQEDASEETVIHRRPGPNRAIYCIDYRASQDAEEYRQELLRILATRDLTDRTGITADALPPTTGRSELTLEMLQRYENPSNDTYVGAPLPSSEDPATAATAPASIFGSVGVVTIDEHPGRRWYPVIDFSRCTNCMECIDFCLFGVYGVDSAETIVVEQADNCRKGCPACSRVCPQNAIIFPQHKTPAIAGAPVDAGGLKIDLSKLFGAPESDEDAADVAARERDEQLILAGRPAVGSSGGLQDRLAQTPPAAASDELDQLLDELDSLDL